MHNVFQACQNPPKLRIECKVMSSLVDAHACILADVESHDQSDDHITIQKVKNIEKSINISTCM